MSHDTWTGKIGVLIPFGVEDPEDVRGRLGNEVQPQGACENCANVVFVSIVFLSYLSDGLTGLSCAGSWIPWRVLYRNPSKSLNESVPLYCSPMKTYKYLLIFLFAASP